MSVTMTEYFEIDSRKKNEDWATKLITHFRQRWVPLVSEKRAKDGTKYIMSDNDMDRVVKMFKDPTDAKIQFNFLPIAIMEKVRNILIAERNKAGIYINLNALDPSAKNEKDEDYQLLKHRREIEAVMTALQQEIGLPEYKLANEKKVNGKDVFKGNINQFDEMNLDETDDHHIDFYFKTYYKLGHEISGQEAINYFVRYNELKNNIDYWCNDIMGKKAISLRTYVNEQNGAITYKYIVPEKIKLIAGNKKDAKDALCIGFEDNTTVSEIIQMMGSHFDWNIHAPFLLKAVNYSNGANYTGVVFGESVTGSIGKTCSYSEFLEFKVGYGYVEWKSNDAEGYKVGTGFHNNVRMYKVPPTHQISTDSIYAKEVYYNEVTYKSYYLTTGTSDQKLFAYGKLFHQVVEGADDEYSNYSIIVRTQEGPTIAEIAAPFIEMAQDAFYKFRWFIRKAKPGGRAYNYESLVKIATKMIGSGNKASDIHQVIKMFEDGINEIFTLPEVNGQVMGGGNSPNHDKKNGLDPTALDFMKIVDWAADQISQKVGTNELREAYSPSPNDGYKLQMQSLAQSRNATEYMSNMIMSVLENVAKYTLTITQDIIKYKDSLAYKFLKVAIGEDNVNNLDSMKYAFHRYGIFIDTFNNDIERQEIKAATMDAWTKQEISYETMMLVNGIDDPKKAGMILSFEKWRNQKIKEKELAQQHANAMELQKQKDQAELNLVITKGRLDIAGKNVEGQWYFKAHKAGADARIEATRIRNDHEEEKTEIRTNADIKKEQAKANLERQAPV